MSTFLKTTLSDIMLRNTVTNSSEALICQNYTRIMGSASAHFGEPFIGTLVDPTNPQKTCQVTLLTPDQHKEKVRQLATLWNNCVKAEGFDLWIIVAVFATGFSYFVAPFVIASGSIVATIIVGSALLIGTIVSIAKVILNAREANANKKKAIDIPRLINELAQQHVVRAQNMIFMYVTKNRQWSSQTVSAFALEVFIFFANNGDEEAIDTSSINKIAAACGSSSPEEIQNIIASYNKVVRNNIGEWDTSRKRIFQNNWKYVYLTVYGRGHDATALENARRLSPLPNS